MTNKLPFFKAVHKETKEAIGFGVEDIQATTETYPGQELTLVFGTLGRCTKGGLVTGAHWLKSHKDYNLFYLHEGEYYAYEI